ncbi:NAD-glutamate dehydrogenase domain-containing protein [Gordonia sp. OPL2]|uniref:NAD-glutamate dehydrogenase domain-containing protein n=1 Tax=Gordonia sp. OPL2 TaxID=2486274 RepID=UPI0016566881|nr:NAD-glutamate dehydrogenase domain-containing protein [Gordonia sp. OPL2]ROZ99318.1 NAD-glutamate dehydrogenase [Gordonia sp. OPL2]
MRSPTTVSDTTDTPSEYQRRHDNRNPHVGGSSGCDREDVSVYIKRAGVDGPSSRLQFILHADEVVPMRQILPVFDSMDLEAIEEHTKITSRADGSTCHVHEFTLEAGRHAAEAVVSAANDADRATDLDERVTSTFHAVREGLADADGFNALVPTAGLTWRDVVLLRALGRYLRQSRLPYSQSRIEQVFLDTPESAVAMTALMDARFARPSTPSDAPERCARVDATLAQVDRHIQEAAGLDADRILRGYRNVIMAITRTNAYRPDAFTSTRTWLAFKIAAETVDELPQPRPLAEIFVFSPEVEGVHMRFGLVARGGLRWSDRLDDYRTEVLGLAKAQAVKNAVIVPAGAKGVFVAKTPSRVRTGRRALPPATAEHGRACYRQFISGLLDVTDNQTTSGVVEPPSSTVIYDCADPYLVVAADKGTATFSDTANAIARDRSYWLGDAFASGGSSGYDHKAMGITARGAWVSAQTHLRELGIDTVRDDFTVVGIGDMSGDVFGNGMLLSAHIGLVAAFDHRHIFVDPDPDRSRSLAERRRLFEKGRSSWGDYDRALISDGGGVWFRTAKSIPVSASMRASLGVDDEVELLTPDQLIAAILTAPVDLLWSAGVGTYVKASDESHANIGDKVNDGVRVDATSVRARAIAEGGNLGVSPRARIQFARRGGLINSDAIDNAAGVDSSDHEVNIKIQLASSDVTARLEPEERASLLASMADDVAAHVLRNNRHHNEVLSDARFNSAHFTDVYGRIVADLESRRGLNRGLECLPEAAEFDILERDQQGLVNPQLATVLAHVKLDLKSQLLQDEVLEAEWFEPVFSTYFPDALTALLGDSIDQHPLRREITATVLVNEIIAAAGITYPFRLVEDTGATASDIVRAYAVATTVFRLPDLWTSIRGADLPTADTNALVVESRRLLDRASRWFLSNRPQPLDIGVEIDRFEPVVSRLSGEVADMLCGNEADTVEASTRSMVERDLPREIAQRLAESLYAYSLLDIVEIAAQVNLEPDALARVYYALSDHLRIDELLIAVSSLPRGDRWQSLSRIALREDLYRSLRRLSVDVVKCSTEAADSPVAAIGQWEQQNRARLSRCRRTLDELRRSGATNVEALTVATTQIRRMTQTG